MTTPRTSKATRHKPKAASDAKPVEPRVKPSLHPRNRHQGRYDFPQLISVPRDGLLADATEEALPVGVKVRVLLGDEAAVLPDLEVVETMIGEALANAA